MIGALHGTHPAMPEQAPVVICGTCKRILGSVTAAIRETPLGRAIAAAMERGLVRCPDCGPLDRGEVG